MAVHESSPSVEVLAERDVAVPMRDGTVLRADVYRPRQEGPFPVLLLRIPYDKRVAQSYTYANPIWYARFGYVVVIQDTRGRFASDGEFRPLLDEARDGADTIEWCSRLQGSAGKVGTFGFSYAGANQLLAAGERPSGLMAACPALYLTSMYEGFGYVGGAFALSTMAQWYALIGGNGAARAGQGFDLVGRANALAGQWPAAEPIGTIPLLSPNPLTPYAADLLTRAAPAAGEPDLEGAELNAALPCLHVAGWFDTFVPQSLGTYARMIQAGAAEQRLLVGPWQHIPWSPHVGEANFGPEAAGSIVDDYQLAFYEAQLKGDRSRLDRLPPVAVFVLGSNRWEAHSAWPPHDAAETTLFLHGRGRANTAYGDGSLSAVAPGAEPTDHLIYNPFNPVPSTGGRSTGGPGTPTGPCDQSLIEERNEVLCYTTEPFAESIQIAGPVTLELHAATSAVDTDFVAKLCRVEASGRSTNFSDGIIRGRFAFDRRQEALLEPGQVYRFIIRLSDICTELAAGERLRLQVTSSDYPAYDRNPNSGVPLGTETGRDMIPAAQTIYHDAAHPSRLTLLTRKPGGTAPLAVRP